MPDPLRPRLLLIGAYRHEGATLFHASPPATREAWLAQNPRAAPLLADIEWEFHPGALAAHGPGGVETREEFAIAGARRLDVVREACAAGRFAALVLLGGGDPGYPEARMIAHGYGVVVTACAHAQMLAACALGNRFAILDVSEGHAVHMADLVARYRMVDRCAAIRSLDFPLPRPAHAGRDTVEDEALRFRRDGTSPMLEAAVEAAEAAIEEDGAEVLMLGCSAAYWLAEPLAARLAAAGWDVPVLEGHRTAIALARFLVALGVDASGLAWPRDPPRRQRRRIRV